MNVQIFKQGLGVLLQAFPNRKLDSGVLYAFLKDIPDQEFLKGITEIITTQKELYPDTNIIALIREKSLVKPQLVAGEAWAIVLRGVSSVGSYGYPKFDNSLIDKAVDAIGWINICRSENIAIERAHFLKIYDVLAQREKESQMLITDSKFKLLIKDALGILPKV